MIQIESILLPTDFSECSKQAAKYACELARRFHAEVHVLHVIQPIGWPVYAAPVMEQSAEIEEAARKELSQWMAPELEEGANVMRIHKTGEPFVEIVRYAKEHNIDLITMGTHGRSGLTHVLIGSVAERVVRKAPCPVLAVRPEGHQFVMP